MRVRVREQLGRGLCATCREAQIIEHDDGTTLTLCNAHSVAQQVVIRRPVARCSDYSSRLQMTKWDMEKVAWVLEKKGNRIGFVKPKPKSDEVAVRDALDAVTDLAKDL